MADLEPLHAIQADPAHMRFYPHPFSLDETRVWIERMAERYARDGFALLAVEDRATGTFLGNVGPMVQHVDDVDEVELGWSITPTRAREGSRRRRRPPAAIGSSPPSTSIT
jgi:RimJ/RimL family protein N-acetyltransferase